MFSKIESGKKYWLWDFKDFKGKSLANIDAIFFKDINILSHIELIHVCIMSLQHRKSILWNTYRLLQQK